MARPRVAAVRALPPGVLAIIARPLCRLVKNFHHASVGFFQTALIALSLSLAKNRISDDRFLTRFPRD